MQTVSLKDAKATFSSLVEQAHQGDFVTITRHGKPVAVLVSIDAADLAQRAFERQRSGLVAYLKTFPAIDAGEALDRNPAAARAVEF